MTEWSEGLGFDERAKRYLDAHKRLQDEYEVIKYLREQGNDKAADVAQRNIARMQQTVTLFRRDIEVE